MHKLHSGFFQNNNYKYPPNRKYPRCCNCESQLPRYSFYVCGYQGGRNTEFQIVFGQALIIFIITTEQR
ncbi:hypothetical protein PUN28_004282 [Cardiocondyla obscurior]|uniref:Uncharacterized protein n=1 Tax=Cardiocondyla obscurior TaxID=286306 RepID=A0AAW2GBP4_9HYME